ncbi:MAG: M48 family metallopeptidase [Synechococcus sp. Tobar2m-G35]|nr:M48 family metallopeptidase [Synechococcus sp. Tobar2m-G35]
MPNHGEAFQTVLDQHLPEWRQRRQLLNEGPLVSFATVTQA